MTEHYNVDMTVAAENGVSKTKIKNQLESVVDLNSDELEEVVMISKVEKVERDGPEEFIQDRKGTDAETEVGDRYVLTRVYSNGDVDDIAYSNEREELEEIMSQ